MKNVRTASFPEWRGIIDSLSFKTITRVISDGIPLKLAIRESIKIGELNKQDIFYFLSRLQDFGMVHNGDPKNYWATGFGEGIGEDSIETVPGTNYYASNKAKIKTASIKREAELFELFASVDNLRESGISDETIVLANPDMQTILDAMDDFDLYETADLADQTLTKTAMPIDTENPVSIYRNLVFEAIKGVKSGKNFNEAMKEAAWNKGLNPGANLTKLVDIVRRNDADIDKIMTEMGIEGYGGEGILHDFSSYSNGGIRTAQAAPPANPAPVAPAAPIAAAPEGGDEMSGLDEALSDTGVEEGPEVSEDIPAEGSDDQVNVEVTPTPSELMDLAQNGPEWDVKNMLSLTKAQKYYESLKESLEAVVYNENLKMDLDSVGKYDRVRAGIDAELEKIDEAVKGKKKIENKEQQLEEDVNEQPEVMEEPMDVMEAPPAAAPVEESEITE